MSTKLFWIELTQVGDDNTEANLTKEKLEDILNTYCLPDEEVFPNAEFKVKEIKPIILNLEQKEVKG